jgi:hypothetical protein
MDHDPESIDDILSEYIGRKKSESQYTHKKHQKCDDKCSRDRESEVARDIAEGVAEDMHERTEVLELRIEESGGHLDRVGTIGTTRDPTLSVYELFVF